MIRKRTNLIKDLTYASCISVLDSHVFFTVMNDLKDKQRTKEVSKFSRPSRGIACTEIYNQNP